TRSFRLADSKLLADRISPDRVADHPQDLVPDVRLQTVEGEDDPLLLAQHPPQSPIIGEGDRQQFVVAVQEVQHGPLGDHQTASDQVAADLGDRAVLAVAQPAHEGDDVETELVVRQRSEEHTSELQSLAYLVCRLLLEKKKRKKK